MFESIRNFLRTKKKSKDKDGAGVMDASFKRSDSFKRISIRKSYLDRGRKRAAMRARAIGNSMNSTCTSSTSQIASVSKPGKTAEVKNGIFVGSVPSSIFNNQPDLNQDSDSVSKETEVQIIAVDFQEAKCGTSNRICNEVINEENISNVNVEGTVDFSDDYSVHGFNLNTCQESKQMSFEDIVYDKADVVRLENESAAPSLITFKTFTPDKHYLETSFDSIESVGNLMHSNSLDSIKPVANISRTTLVYDTPSSNNNFTGESIVIRISGTTSSGGSNEDEMNMLQHEIISKKESIDSALELDSELILTDGNSNKHNHSNQHQRHRPPDEHVEKKHEDVSMNEKYTFEIFKELQSKKSEGPVVTASRASSLNDIHFGVGSSITLDEVNENPSSPRTFQSFVFDPEIDLYDNADIISPDSSIPYPLRVKTNPFTRQKELYSVNLGRIWKQLNLGQDEDLSLDMSTTFKKKNESFKSMSSHDSGFSLTLTKPKSLFRRKPKQGTYARRNKAAKLAVSRDSFVKRPVIVQRNSSRRRRVKRSTYDTYGRKKYNNESFLREFEEFCAARRQHMIAKRNFTEFGEFYGDEDFNQEMSDLEAFFEDHLRKLKSYYLERKKLNETALSEFYNDFPLSESDYTFPHPDKRQPVPSKKKHKYLFQEVRTFNDDTKYSSLEFTERGRHCRGDEKIQYADIDFDYDNRNMFDYPKSWHMTAKKKSFGRHGRRYRRTSSCSRKPREICLANIFPAVDQPPALEISGGDVCTLCCKPFSTERTPQRRWSIASDEFSEQEFLSNCELCWECDNQLAECVCIRENVNNDEDDYCSCPKDIRAINRNEIPVGKRKVRRKKSKRKIRKNHSTLRKSFSGNCKLVFVLILNFCSFLAVKEANSFLEPIMLLGH